MLNKKVEGGKKTNERGESNGIRNPGQDLFTLFLQSKFKCTPYPRDTSFPSFLPLLANFQSKWQDPIKRWKCLSVALGY